MPENKPAAVGLDFGTSNSTVGLVRPGHPTLLPLENGEPTLPSVIFFNEEDGAVAYGREALTEYLDGQDGRLMRSLKSLLGTSLIDEQTEVGGRALPFRAVLAQFIGELKRRAEGAAGVSLQKAVIGRPVFFVDDDAAADRAAEETLAEIARSVGFTELAFQYEPIAAAFHYEAQISQEQLVLIADIGGGTSDFSVIRLGPERALKADRRADILAYSGVHIGGTDFDKYLSLDCVMPMLGLGSKLRNGKEIPSSYYFDLATWHTIHRVYTPRVRGQLQDIYRDACEKDKVARLQHLIQHRAGHWLALKVEAAKIGLSRLEEATLHLERLPDGVVIPLQRAAFEAASLDLVSRIETTVSRVLSDAGVAAGAIDVIFFTGGSSGVPLLRQRIAALLPGARVEEGDLFGSIGAGLALEAARKLG